MSTTTTVLQNTGGDVDIYEQSSVFWLMVGDEDDGWRARDILIGSIDDLRAFAARVAAVIDSNSSLNPQHPEAQ